MAVQEAHAKTLDEIIKESLEEDLGEKSTESIDWKALSYIKFPYSDSDKFKYFVSRNQDKPWDWNAVLRKFFPSEVTDFIKFDTVVSNPDAKWPWSNLTNEFLSCVPRKRFVETKHLNWDWKIISKVYGNIHQLDEIHIFKDCPLDWDIISENMNESIKRRILSLDDLPQGYFVKDDFKKFLNYLDLPWNWEIIYSGLPKAKKDKLDTARKI